MKKIALLLMAFASLAALGGTASGLPGMPGRSVATDGFVTKTTNALTLYVDPLGNNNNTCTGTGVNACSTLTGAFSKLPNRIDYTTTINIAGAADGGIATYTETPSLNADMYAALNITGPSLTRAAVTTGTASGSLTTVSNIIPPVYTDSTQTWTTGDLIGMFFVPTSGAQSGTVRVIANNTATTLTLASPYTTAPLVNDTYEIRVPGVILTGSTSLGTTLKLRLGGFTGDGTVAGNAFTNTITGIDFVHTGTGTACGVSTSNSTLAFTNSRCIGLASSGSALSFTGTVRSNISAFLANLNGVSFSSSSTVGIGGMSSSFVVNHTLIHSTGSSSRAILVGGGTVATLTPNGSYTVQTNGTSSSTGAFELQASITQSSASSSYTIVRCLQAGPSGIYFRGNNAVPATTGAMWFENLYIDGCTTGINLSGLNPFGFVGILGSGLFVCNSATTCINVANGSSVRLPTANFTADAGSANVTAITLDGVNYTTSDLTSASPTRITNMATSSTVWQ